MSRCVGTSHANWVVMTDVRLYAGTTKASARKAAFPACHSAPCLCCSLHSCA